MTQTYTVIQEETIRVSRKVRAKSAQSAARKAELLRRKGHRGKRTASWVNNRVDVLLNGQHWAAFYVD